MIGALNALPPRPNPTSPTSIIASPVRFLANCQKPSDYANNFCPCIASTVRLRQNAMMSAKTQIPAQALPVSQSAIFYLLCAGFVLNGVVICLIGPILPVFRDKFGLDDSRAGLFSTMQFSFSLAGVLLSSPLTAVKGFKPAITLGVTMLGIGFALLNPPTFALAR